MPGVRGEKVPGVALRLLREHESPRFSLHKYGRRVDDRGCSLARGENSLVISRGVGMRSVISVHETQFTLMSGRSAYRPSCSALY